MRDRRAARFARLWVYLLGSCNLGQQGGKLAKKSRRLFSIESRRNEERESRSVKVNMELLKYLPRPEKPVLLFWEAGRHSKSSGADYGLRAHECVCAHINTHQQIRRQTQTSYLELYLQCIYIPPTCLNTHTHTHKVISDVPQGAGLCRVTTLWASFGVRGSISWAQNNPGSVHRLPLGGWWQNGELTS